MLSLLNQDFFDEVRKRDANEVINHFGPRVGKLLIKQAYLEEKFNTVCVEDGVKMTPLTDEFITDDARQCALELRETTSELIRAFSIKENELKLRAHGYHNTQGELSNFLEAFKHLEEMMLHKLVTPLEEMNSVKENIRTLKEKTKTLSELKDQKDDAFKKYCEECSNNKELRKH